MTWWGRWNRSTHHSTFNQQGARYAKKSKKSYSTVPTGHRDSHLCGAAPLLSSPLLSDDLLAVNTDAIRESIRTDAIREPIRDKREEAAKHPKRHHHLVEITKKLHAMGVTPENAGSKNVRALSTPLVKIDNTARIQVYIETDKVTKALLQALKAQGVEIEIVNDTLGIIQGWVPYDRLEVVSEQANVKKIRPPDYAVPNVGSVTTEGDAILLADELRPMGFDGAGVGVGVISDGVEAIAESVALGDLPDGITTFGSCVSEGSCDEGTAMLEIVHDLAPEAELGFGSGGTSLAFIESVADLTETFAADIIVDDLAGFGEPYFEDGPMAQAVQAAIDSGVLYVSAAGNYAEQHYEADSVDVEGLHDFGAAAGESNDDTMDVLLAAGESITVFLQWNDPFGASDNDYDLAIFNETVDVLLGFSVAVQDGDDDPSETAIVTNTTESTMRVKIVVVQVTGAADRRLEMFILGGVQGDDYLIEEYVTPEGSIFGHAALSKAIAVGAIDAADEGNDTIRDFSSQGPSAVYFPLFESRTKPDIAAIDGVSVTGVGGFPSIFAGTSAAAPHVAGLAALLMELSPSATADDIRNALLESAVDLGDPGIDTVYGNGRADVFAAAEAVNAPPDSTINLPATDQTIQQGESVTFGGTCTDDNDAQGMASSWSFGDGSGIAGSADEDPGATVFNNAGTFSIRLTCTDGFDATDASPATRTITVLAPEPAPAPAPTPTPESAPASDVDAVESGNDSDADEDEDNGQGDANPSLSESKDPVTDSPSAGTAGGGCSLMPH